MIFDLNFEAKSLFGGLGEYNCVRTKLLQRVPREDPSVTFCHDAASSVKVLSERVG